MNPHEFKKLAEIGHIATLNSPWEEVLHLAIRMDCPKGTVIPHLRVAGMYYLASGSVTISYFSSCGRERLALYIHPRCLFNEARTVSGFEPGGRFLCTSDSVLYRFPEKILESHDFILQYPHLIVNIIKSMGIKMLIHYTFLAGMGTGDHVVHLCRFIYSLFQQNSEKTTFPCSMTQQEVANLLGIHKATLLRAVAQLKRLGVIRHFTHKAVHITNAELLKSIARQ